MFFPCGEEFFDFIDSSELWFIGRYIADVSKLVFESDVAFFFENCKLQVMITLSNQINFEFSNFEITQK